ncbi:MAG: MFS transporter, partial [Parabacteroides sp.]
NIGALFAPTAAEKITDYFMTKAHLIYDPAIPALAHQLQEGTISETGRQTLLTAANQMSDAFATQGNDLAQFGNYYISQLSTSYHYAFAVACISLIISAAIYFGFRYTFKSADYNSKTAKNTNHVEEVLTPKETKDRVVALLLVFAVVIFFWMAFHQNGGTMTLFARDYTNKAVTGITRFGFDVWNLVLLIIVIYGSFSVAQAKETKGKLISGIVVLVALIAFFIKYANMPETMNIQPQIFQHFNPCFVVALTPFSILLFGTLAKKGKEPSAPRKIGLGMLVAAIGFSIMAAGSVGQVSPADLKDVGGVSQALVSPSWLISTYLVLTFAELLLSPMGISFVSKVAPPKYKGMMMGGWFVATAIGNYATSIIGHLWSSHLALWMVWSVLIILCLLSALFMFSIMKKLEKVAK